MGVLLLPLAQVGEGGSVVAGPELWSAGDGTCWWPVEADPGVQQVAAEGRSTIAAGCCSFPAVAVAGRPPAVAGGPAAAAGRQAAVAG